MAINRFDLTQEIVDSLVATKKPFTFEQLEQEIDDKNGIGRVAPCYTVKEYLDDLIDQKIIFYDLNDQTYYNWKSLERKMQKYLRKN